MTKLVKPEGMMWVNAYLMVQNVDAAADFYQKAFGFEKKDMMAGDDGTTWHGELKYKTQIIMIGKEGAYGKRAESPLSSGVESPMSLILYCEDVDAFYEHAITAGAKSVSAPEDMFWGDRICRVKDVDNYTWCFATYLNKPQL